MNADGGVFAPLSQSEREAVTEIGSPAYAKNQVVRPIPKNAPEPDWEALRPVEAEGSPAKIWTYELANGDPVFLVVRWQKRDGGKVIRPVTWNGYRWGLKAMPEPRPLYKLPGLLSLANKPVLIVEGEK